MMRTCALIFAVILAGCALKTPPSHDVVVGQALPQGTQIPPSWKANPDSSAVTDDWLKSFNDPVLDAIVAEAMANNLDLRQAADRVTIAQQSVVVVGAQLLPQIGGQAGAEVTHYSGDGRDRNLHTSHNTLLAGSVAWELDVWGKLRAQRAASQAIYEATSLEYAYARLSLAAIVARSWYQTTETYQLVLLAEQAVNVYSGLLELVRIKRAAGKDTDLDVADALAKLQTAQSELEGARNTYNESRRTLEELLGRYPAAEIATATTYPPLPTPVGAGVPALLLERRPDLVAAEREVIAAFRQEEAARLALLPSFSISLLGERYNSNHLAADGLGPWFTSAGIGMFIPIYEGGGLLAQVEIATAQQALAVANYGKVALSAFREVENALANEAVLGKQLYYEEGALKSRTTEVEIANFQYRAGRRDLLWVEQLQAEQIAFQGRVIKLYNARIANQIQLHLALGGNFDARAADVRKVQ